MAVGSINDTELSTMVITPTFTWCFLMPLIHLLSLISNILCIIVFCSNIFIKKPIAIYFICLLISDSITLLIGYIEMIDRETSMVDKSSFLCKFNGKIIHTITDYIYTFMGRFCLEWMLYKVLWTRASTILLAILSVQRSRTFFSLSYHETRLCAFIACISSIIIAITITCLEWIGVQFNTINNLTIFYEIFELINKKISTKNFYLTYLTRNYNESIISYPCMINFFNIKLLPSITTNQLNCSSNKIASEFYNLTKSFVSTRENQIDEITINLLNSLTYPNDNILNDSSILKQTIEIAKTSEILGRLFEKRTCHITINYSIWLKFYDFLYSVSFTLNRRSLAIFFGNALPSFIVVLANLLSIKVIYFSKSLKYIKQSTKKIGRKHRLQNDLRAFLVILIESFSIIMISWGIPILLTMYHCKVLYVIIISTCPKIKDYLAFFLFTDLFNSSTNCLLYSLSGKLFRRKFLSIIKCILTCGRGTLWNVKQHLLLRQSHQLDRQVSNNNNNNNNFPKQSSSRAGSMHYSEHLSSPIVNNSNTKFNYSPKTTTITTTKNLNGKSQTISNDSSINDSNEKKHSLSEIDYDTKKKSNVLLRKNSQTIKSFLMNKVHSFNSTNNNTNEKILLRTNPSTLLTIDKKKKKSKEKFFNRILSKRQTSKDLSGSLSSFTGSLSHSSQRKYSSKILSNNMIDNLSIKDNKFQDNLTIV